MTTEPVTPPSPAPTKANKAWVAALIAALGAFVAAVQGADDLGNMGPGEWLTIILSAAVVGVGTYMVPNPPK